MRVRGSLFALSIVLSIAMPLLAVAASGSAAAANIGPSTPADAKACILKLFQAQNQQKAPAGQPTGATTDGLKDNCTSETINVAANGTKTITQTGRTGNNNLTNGCMADSCSAPNCGTVTLVFNIPGLAAPAPISKCDPNYQKDLSAASGNTAAATNNFALSAINQNAVQAAIQSGNPTTVANALQAFGVSSDQATDIATNHPADATNLLNAFASGNGATISSAVQAASQNGVTLNQDTLSSITSLTPQQVSQNLSSQSLLTADQQTTVSNISNSPDTFAQPAPSATSNTSNISSSLSPLCNQLGGCGNVCPNSSVMVCNTNNPGALTWDAWEAKYGGYQCGQNNNTTCFPTMEQGIEAQARLLTTTSTYFGNGTNTIWGEFCGSNYASGPGSNCASYANFVSQQTGIPINQTIDPNNAQQIGSIIMAQSRMESGVGVIFTPDQLQTGLGLAYGTQSLPGGTPGYTLTTVSTGVGGLSGVIAGGNTTGQVMLSSPFANVSPVYGTPGLGSTSAYPTLPIQYSQPAPQPAQSAPAPAPAPVTPVTQPISATTSVPVSTAQTANAVAQIIAQPQSVSAGNPVSVSWSSAGMSATSLCQVMENDAVIASGNDGSQIVTATSIGTLSFSLSCTAQGTGASVTGSASVSVQ